MGAAGAALADGMIRVALNGKAFGSVQVLGPVCFEVAPGEVLAILGRSGVGKSTLLRLVAGIDTNVDGEIERPHNIAIVVQEPTLLPWRCALDNVLLFHSTLAPETAEAILERVGLGGRGSAYPGQLSLGQQRRLALARAFVGKPELLILDEPFVSLDPDTAEAMLDLTEALISEARPAVVFVTHARAEAERLADRILILAGTPAVLSPGGGGRF